MTVQLYFIFFYLYILCFIIGRRGKRQLLVLLIHQATVLITFSFC